MQLSNIRLKPENLRQVMTITKVLCPIIRQRKLFLDLKPILLQRILIRFKSNKEGSLTKSTRSEIGTNVKPLGQKVKESTKTASYLGVILLGVGVTGALFYAVFSELFSSKSPNSVYTKAVKACMEDDRVRDKLGMPIKAYGEETRRGRRQHVGHLLYEKDGKKHLRMKFYLQGAFFKGTVDLEMAENDSGKYEYRYLFINVHDMLQTVIVLEDNRQKSISPSRSFTLFN